MPKVELTGIPQVMVSTLSRAISSTLTRGLAMMVFPIIFSSWPGWVTIMLAFVLPIYFWDGIVALHQKRREKLKLKPQTPDTDEADSE